MPQELLTSGSQVYVRQRWKIYLKVSKHFSFPLNFFL